MSMGSKSYKCIKILSRNDVRIGATLISPSLSVQHSTRLLQSQHFLKAVGIRNISTSNKLWANISFNLTDIGEGIREVVVKEWYVKVGDRVSQFDNICEVQSDKASVTITSRYDGTITKLYHAVDGIAHVGKPLIDIDAEGTEESTNDIEEKPSHNNEKHQVPDINPKDYKRTLCIPSVRRLAKEHNIDLAKINGTGKDGRVLKEDVLNFLQLPKPLDGTAMKTWNEEPIASDRIEKITGFKKVMVKTMTDALKIPHFVYSDEIIVTKLNQIRNVVKDSAENAGTKLTVLSFFVKAVSNALHKYPIINASVDSNCDNIIYKSAHNIGIAMDTSAGLVVPVIKNVEKLSVLQIAKELDRFKYSGKQGSFQPSDLSGGTFTISNIGSIGGTYTAPIVLSPQVSIIALGATKVLPRFDSMNNVVREEILSLSGSADHRIVDGATMARFVTLVKKQVENPYLLFLNT